MKWGDEEREGRREAEEKGGFRSVFRAPNPHAKPLPPALKEPVESDATPRGDGVTGYEPFSTFALEATLVSLRASMIVHGPTASLPDVRVRIETELAKRKDGGDD